MLHRECRGCNEIRNLAGTVVGTVTDLTGGVEKRASHLAHERITMAACACVMKHSVPVSFRQLLVSFAAAERRRIGIMRKQCRPNRGYQFGHFTRFP